MSTRKRTQHNYSELNTRGLTDMDTIKEIDTNNEEQNRLSDNIPQMAATNQVALLSVEPEDSQAVRDELFHEDPEADLEALQALTQNRNAPPEQQDGIALHADDEMSWQEEEDSQRVTRGGKINYHPHKMADQMITPSSAKSIVNTSSRKRESVIKRLEKSWEKTLTARVRTDHVSNCKNQNNCNNTQFDINSDYDSIICTSMTGTTNKQKKKRAEAGAAGGKEEGTTKSRRKKTKNAAGARPKDRYLQQMQQFEIDNVTLSGTHNRQGHNANNTSDIAFTPNTSTMDQVRTVNTTDKIRPDTTIDDFNDLARPLNNNLNLANTPKARMLGDDASINDYRYRQFIAQHATLNTQPTTKQVENRVNRAKNTCGQLTPCNRNNNRAGQSLNRQTEVGQAEGITSNHVDLDEIPTRGPSVAKNLNNRFTKKQINEKAQKLLNNDNVSICSRTGIRINRTRTATATVTAREAEIDDRQSPRRPASRIQRPVHDRVDDMERETILRDPGERRRSRSRGERSVTSVISIEDNISDINHRQISEDENTHPLRLLANDTHAINNFNREISPPRRRDYYTVNRNDDEYSDFSEHSRRRYYRSPVRARAPRYRSPQLRARRYRSPTPPGRRPQEEDREYEVEYRREYRNDRDMERGRYRDEAEMDRYSDRRGYRRDDRRHQRARHRVLSGQSYDEEYDTDSSNDRRRRGKRSLKSGINAKPTSSVQVQLRYPHFSLGQTSGFIGQNIMFHQLTFDQFVAGELTTITNTLDNAERQGRLKLLQLVSQWNLRANVAWTQVRNTYAHILRLIENSQIGWYTDFSQFERHIYDKVTSRAERPKNKSPIEQVGSLTNTQNNKPIAWFCRNYQRPEGCQKSSPHVGRVGNKFKQLEHICAACWIKDRVKRQHPECSDECPSKEQ